MDYYNLHMFSIDSLLYLVTCGKYVLLVGEPIYSIPVDPGLSIY